VRDYHRRFPVHDVTGPEDDSALLKEEPPVAFTGEEGMGRCGARGAVGAGWYCRGCAFQMRSVGTAEAHARRPCTLSSAPLTPPSPAPPSNPHPPSYLDLHELHRAFTNARFGRQVDYLEYLTSFADFSATPQHLKLAAGYRRAGLGWVGRVRWAWGGAACRADSRPGGTLTPPPKPPPTPPPTPRRRQYLQQLLDYLVSFYERTQPLAQLRRQLDKLEEELKGQFEEGAVPGWEDRGVGHSGSSAEELGIDLEGFDTVEEVEIMGEGVAVFGSVGGRCWQGGGPGAEGWAGADRPSALPPPLTPAACPARPAPPARPRPAQAPTA
jgi:splicing factor 3A subunit 3